MRFVVLAVILVSLPAFMSMLRSHPHKRGLAFTAIGLMLFLGDTLRIDGAIIAWPLWTGTVRGMEISPIDSLSLALILTRPRLPGRVPLWGVIAFYGAAVTMSLVPASVPMATFFVCWQFARMTLLFAALASEIHRDDLRGGLLTGLSLGLMLQASYVIQQKAHGMVQATGTMFHQNSLGMMTELALLPLLAALLAGDRRKLIVAGIGAGLIVIAGGGSRGAMAISGGGVVVLMLLSLIRGYTPVKGKVVGLGMLALAIAAPLAALTLKDRFGSNSITAQDDQRPAFERAATAMASDHPFGVGANLYVPTANTKGYADRAGVAWNFANRSAPVHNAYLLTRAETGWLGELALILMLVVPLLAGLRLAFSRRQGFAGEMALGSAVAMGVNIVHNNFEFAVVTYNVLAMVFLNLAIIASQIRGERYRKNARPAPQRAPAPRLTPGLAVAGRRAR
ncbi:MAG: hypothetical protein J0I47_11560 [Sphingomonas sp.]|uniref:O-antigen ligase family protein n=1 Tax=Sphingomonas sp. TaxID=28214 RepID=UPI001AC51F55|nr:hypothetical protein [Sphingomonas sp.]MBN8808850.1 hypothetical protein [Sphingomonas sp.]